MIIIIRGHIRKSFNNPKLLNLIKDIYKIHNDIKIYIHTWNIFSNNLSWRQIDIDNNLVTKKIINEYFEEYYLLIKDILIEDDENIELIGLKEGYVNSGPCPIRGYKNHFYGNYKIIEHINNLHNNKKECILNFRFDVLENSCSIEDKKILELIEKNINIKFEKNIFINDYEFCGCCNIYIGNIYTMLKLIKHMYYFFDEIMKKHNNTIHQEFFIFRENNSLDWDNIST